jgi:uncharacterized protein YbgA (DUF1722 family)/uncharacterized protein YbbK (DUF523 family)
MNRVLNETTRPRLAVSACLLGQKVRFDGGHKQSRLVKDVLGSVCDLVPLCPEVGIGMGTPRQPIRLVKMAGGDVAAKGSREPDLDVTEPLSNYLDQVEHDVQGVNGYIFMQKSPSCGLFRVKLYNEAGHSLFEHARGLYADAVVKRFPDLPCEESGRLCDVVLFENFVTRVYSDFEWKQMLATGPSLARITDFHSRHKLLIMAHCPAAVKPLGALFASLKDVDAQDLADRYYRAMMDALNRKASRGTHGYVLAYMSKFIKPWLSKRQRKEWESLVEEYRRGTVPLIVLMTLVRHYAEDHPESFLASQVYLQPHPMRLGLRNSI